MNNVIIAIMLSLFFLCAMVVLAVKIQNDQSSPQDCHTFERTDTSHIRLNSCTGEAHVIVRGPNGFEWQRVVE